MWRWSFHVLEQMRAIFPRPTCEYNQTHLAEQTPDILTSVRYTQTHAAAAAVAATNDVSYLAQICAVVKLRLPTSSRMVDV